MSNEFYQNMPWLILSLKPSGCGACFLSILIHIHVREYFCVFSKNYYQIKCFTQTVCLKKILVFARLFHSTIVLSKSSLLKSTSLTNILFTATLILSR